GGRRATPTPAFPVTDSPLCVLIGGDGMKLSTERILTTHVGSLARPPDLFDMLAARASGQPYDAAAFEARVRQAVADVVRRQAELGIDIINDGEQGKPGFVAYRSEDEFLEAIARAIHEEYRAIVDAGFVLQIDDPRLSTYYNAMPALSLAECRRWAEKRVEFVNLAIGDIPPDRVRFHTCYSIDIGPRIHDMPLKD